MKKAIVHLLDASDTMPLQVCDDGTIAHGLRPHEVVIQIEQYKDHIRFLLENRRKSERAWFTISYEEWQRLQSAPDWHHVSWFPFVTYERITSRGKATLTHREDPLLRKRPDLIAAEFWQARLYLPEGIVTTFTEFCCLAGHDDAFCNASEWTVLVEQGKYNPAYTISSLDKPSINFCVAEGFATQQSIRRECSAREFARLIAQYEQRNGHSTILVRDLHILKALLPNTKIAGEHHPNGLPLH